jgi:hypothetical protein
MDEQEAQDTLVGIWRVKMDGLADTPEIKKLPVGEREAAIKRAQQMLPEIGFEFTPDGKMNLYMGDVIRNGTYKIIKASGDKLTVEMRHGRAKPEVETVEILVGDEILTVTGEGDDGEQVLVLERGAPGTPTGAAEEAVEQEPPAQPIGQDNPATAAPAAGAKTAPAAP